MAVALRGLDFEFKKIGNKVGVPNNPKARLMYYLSCICNLLDLDDDADLTRLRDYENHYQLTDEETAKLLLITAMVSPDVLLENKVIFQDDDMCGDSNNEFYEIGAISKTLVVSNAIIIGGQQRSVKKVMTFKKAWLMQNYMQPTVSLIRELKDKQEREEQLARARARQQAANELAERERQKRILEERKRKKEQKEEMARQKRILEERKRKKAQEEEKERRAEEERKRKRIEEERRRKREEKERDRLRRELEELRHKSCTCIIL